MGYGTAALVGIGMFRQIVGMWTSQQSIKQSKYQQKILKYQSDYLNAAQKIEEEKIKRDVRRVIGSQKAATAASGFQGGFGTSLALEIDTEIQGDLDIALLKQSGSIDQLRLKVAGRMTRAGGYGVASGISGQTTAQGWDTLLTIGNRYGWFDRKKQESTQSTTSAWGNTK